LPAIDHDHEHDHEHDHHHHHDHGDHLTAHIAPISISPAGGH
jgi:hypothetical protein